MGTRPQVLDWKGNDETGYIAEADDAVYIVVPHGRWFWIYRTAKNRAPILWSEALANPHRELTDRLIKQGFMLRAIMETARQGKNFAERDYKWRKEPMVKGWL